MSPVNHTENNKERFFISLMSDNIPLDDQIRFQILQDLGQFTQEFQKTRLREEYQKPGSIKIAIERSNIFFDWIFLSSIDIYRENEFFSLEL